MRTTYYIKNKSKKDEIVNWLRANCPYRFGTVWKYEHQTLYPHISFDTKEAEMLFVLTWGGDDIGIVNPDNK